MSPAWWMRDVRTEWRDGVPYMVFRVWRPFLWWLALRQIALRLVGAEP